MDLLGQEPQKRQKTNGQKIVLMLLITSIILSIFVLVMIFALQGNKTNALGLLIDEKPIQITENMLISDENGVNYISLKQLSTLIGYNYLRGGYEEYAEDNTKCYLESQNQIIGFEENSNEIYKTTQNSETDYEYYNLNNKIIQSNGVLYIALEDLAVGCNVVYTFSAENNKILIYTTGHLSQNYIKTFAENGLTVNNDAKNDKAIIYNMVVAANTSGKLGVLDTTLNTIIGHKYTTMQFDEFSQNFIVSNENKYGIISKDGNIIAELKYENIHIINYSPLLYEVKLNNKVGLLDKNGKLIVNIAYDKIGFSESTNLTEPTLIIENLSNNQDAIVVCNAGKYGLVNLTTSKTILNCDLEKIYSRTDDLGKKQYYVQLQNTEVSLARYIEYINTTTVVTN
ncbi:MAG: WG repeat-containing protein [Clostridia bacterium]|nr:WG repeat-containing protein [Clostridia bacterium]